MAKKIYFMFIILTKILVQQIQNCFEHDDIKNSHPYIKVGVELLNFFNAIIYPSRLEVTPTPKLILVSSAFATFVTSLLQILTLQFEATLSVLETNSSVLM